jgi:hypothetical protein
MIAVIIGAAAIAGEDQEAGKSEEMTSQEMPPMGPPEEMKMMKDVVGVYDVEQQWRMDPASEEWETSNGVATYELILDGAAVRHTYESEMMGMPFHGLGLIAFNRETGKWQQAWVDNMGAQISYYEGNYKDGQMVTVGEEKWQGQTYLARITVYNMEPDGFDWKYEMSMDGGKEYFTSGKAHYTKR